MPILNLTGAFLQLTAKRHVSTTPTQDGKLNAYVAEARRLGVPDSATPLDRAEVQQICASPVFRTGVRFQEGANVQPARLARALRRRAIDLGVDIYENSAMTALETGSPNLVRTAAGELEAREVVLATNVALTSIPEVRRHVTIFSSYALMTNPAEEALSRIGWTGDEGLADMRMFVHYFRRTVDHRILMGSGSGPISFGSDIHNPRLYSDRHSAGRARRALRRLLPGLDRTGVARAWGGPIDVSADRLPFFRTLPGKRVHYAAGYSGHGVNPTYIGGQCLASLVLGARDMWTGLPFCTRDVPAMPPEPFRFVGGRAVRWGIIRCEEADEAGTPAPLLARTFAAIPKALNFKVGVR